jgi:hypothetical protein
MGSQTGERSGKRSFQSAIVDRHEVRNTYAGIKRRHPELGLEAQVVWLVKMIDRFQEEQAFKIGIA